MVSRRQTLAGIATGLTSATALAGCVGGNQSSSQANEIADQLTVYSWYTPWHKEMLKQFRENHNGLQTSLSPYSTNQELYSKLRSSGNSNVDLVMPSNNMLTTLREEGMIQPIQTDQLSRWDLQKPIADQSTWSQFIKADGEIWGVPFARSTYLNMTRKSFVEDGTVPEEYINSWDLYFNGNAGDATIGIGDYARRNVNIVLWHLRGEEADINSDPGNTVEWSTIEDKLVELIENADVIYPHPQNAKQQMVNGDLDVANIWSLFQIQLRNAGVSDARAYMPTQGSAAAFDSFCIPEGANHTYTSHKYIDFVLKPERVIQEYEIVGGVALQDGLREHMSEELLSDFENLLSIDVEKLQLIEANQELQNRATEAWNTAKARAN